MPIITVRGVGSVEPVASVAIVSRVDGATTPDMMLVMRLRQAAAQHRCENEPALQQGTGYASFGSHDRHDDEAHENDQEAQWWGS